ncbi:MAG: hypothetical protein PHP82_03840 [Candidatus ainarchaeum sp.]|nr:hypothetical protein [Candidatus ainarchaeum sp.]
MNVEKYILKQMFSKGKTKKVMQPHFIKHFIRPNKYAVLPQEIYSSNLAYSESDVIQALRKMEEEGKIAKKTIRRKLDSIDFFYPKNLSLYGGDIRNSGR